MLKVYLLRHGLTDWNKLRRVQGSSDIPLNEEGRRVARLTAEGMRDMPIDLVYSSPLKRARETAEIICAGRDVPIVFDDRIREIGFGEFEGVTWPEIYENEECAGFRKFFFDPDNYVPERGAESIEKVIARGKSFLEERIYPHEGEDLTILVAAHGAMIRGLQAAGRGADKTNFWGGPWGGSGKPLKNCGAALVTVENGMMKIVEPSLIFYSEET